MKENTYSLSKTNEEWYQLENICNECGCHFMVDFEDEDGTISSERICPTTIAHGKTLSNPQKDCLENLFQILFTSHGFRSDS